jgi:hypothetical protein
MFVPVATKPAFDTQLFRYNQRLQECLKIPWRHIVPRSQGEHVGLVQQALMRLGVAVVGPGEILTKRFGDDTADARDRREISLTAPMNMRRTTSSAK